MEPSMEKHVLKGSRKGLWCSVVCAERGRLLVKETNKKTYRLRKNSTIAYMFSVGVRLVRPLIYSC